MAEPKSTVAYDLQSIKSVLPISPIAYDLRSIKDDYFRSELIKLVQPSDFIASKLGESVYEIIIYDTEHPHYFGTVYGMISTEPHNGVIVRTFLAMCIKYPGQTCYTAIPIGVYDQITISGWSLRVHSMTVITHGIGDDMELSIGPVSGIGKYCLRIAYPLWQKPDSVSNAKLRKLRKRVNKLEDEIKTLKDMIEFAPDGPGYHEAKTHFELNQNHIKVCDGNLYKDGKDQR